MKWIRKNFFDIISILAIIMFFITIMMAIFKPNNDKIEYKRENIHIIEEMKQENRLKSIGEFVSTAYCPCEKCCGKTDGITSSGTKATEGRTIATDNKIIPRGTKVIINDNEYIAEDTGGTIKGNRIDIYFDTHQEALNYGRRNVEVFVSE